MLIPGGSFYRGNDERYPATVGDFRMDRYEISVGRFRGFMAAFQAGWRPQAGDGKNLNNLEDPGWDGAWNSSYLARDGASLQSNVECEANHQTWTQMPTGHENLPMNCLSWYEAYAFCIWDSARLPTEAEWNYVAAGGEEQRQYPWSIPPADLSIDSSYAVYLADALAPVGSKSPKGDGRWGQSDLAGNLNEWVQDWWSHEYPEECDNCAVRISDASGRVFRGGSFGSDAVGVLTSDRISAYDPADRSLYLGARCARSAVVPAGAGTGPDEPGVALSDATNTGEAPEWIRASGGLDGYLYTAECNGGTDPVECPLNCAEGALTELAPFTIAGDPTATYELTLHVYGVAELHGDYAGGVRRQGDSSNAASNRDFWYVGGSYSSGQGANVYGLRVSPAVDGVDASVAGGNNYFLNARDVSDAAPEVWELNYEAKILVPGGGSVVFFAHAPECVQVMNTSNTARPIGRDPGGSIVVPEVEDTQPPPVEFEQPLETGGRRGQWVFIDVLAVAAQ